MDYPRLTTLMGAYFNQDYDLMGESEAEILDDYARGHYDDEVRQTIAEIRRILTAPLDGLLHRFEAATGDGNMMIGETDAEARDWLEAAAARLEAFVASPNADRADR